MTVVRDITERKLAEEALTESEEFNRRIVESSSDCIKVLDLEGNLAYMSPRGKKLLEIHDLSAYLNKSWIEMWPPESQPLAATAIKRAKMGGVGSFQSFAPTMEGRPKWWDNVVTPIRGASGKIERLLAVSRDITAQKQAVEAVRESESRFAKAFKANPQPMSLTTLEDGRYLDVNESFLSMIGYSYEEVIGHTTKELGIWDKRWHRDQMAETLKTAGTFRNFETTFRTKSGKLKVLLSSAEVLELGGHKCILMASSDITERKSLEEDLRLSEREFSTLVQNSPDVISRLDRNLRYIYISPTAERNTGLSPDSFIGRTPCEVDLSGYDAKHFEASCERAFETGKTVSLDYVYSGRNYWTRIIPEFTPEGTVESVMTISEDVTQRLRQEKELLELTVRLFNLQDEERRRIARELHDGTAQNLFAISINLAKLAQLDHKEEMQQLIDECQTLGDQSLREIRTLSYLLHPPLLDQAGLVSALQWYVEGFSKRSGIYVNITAQPIGRLPSEVETALFRIVQEALANVRRHSGSETASIRLETRSNEVVLEIKDTGRGLRAQNPFESTEDFHELGVGIPGMRQRLRLLGGRLEITSNGGGTSVSAFVPLNDGASYGASTVGR
jgi:PAS domain S-box-containing protein